MFTIKYRYLIIIVLAVYSYFNTVFSEVYLYYRIQVPTYLIIAAFLIITLLVWECNRLSGNYIRRYFSSDSSIKYLVTFFLVGMIVSAIIALLIVFAVNSLFLHFSRDALRMPLKLTFTYATRINLFLHAANLVFVFAKKYRTKELETEELKRINAQAQLQAIKNQVNPHFLFNNLNVLSSLIMLDNPDANKFIEEFAKVYRHILSSQQEELIPLQTELDYMQPYIFLLKKRFPGSINININIPDKFFTWQILPVALQMLIENAIKHNIASRLKPLQIQISIDEQNNLVVYNNLQPKLPDGESTNVGLKNIAQRYDLIAGKQIDIIKTEDRFSVALPLIPKEYENDHN